MLHTFIAYNKIYNGRMCKCVVCLSVFFGATLGIMLWSYVIGVFVSCITGDFSRLTSIALTGSIISIIPNVLGIVRRHSINKRYLLRCDD